MKKDSKTGEKSVGKALQEPGPNDRRFGKLYVVHLPCKELPAHPAAKSGTGFFFDPPLYKDSDMQDPTSASGLTSPGNYSPPLAQNDQEHAEPAMGEAQKVSITCSPKMRIFAIGINILVISELTVAMYMASLRPDEFTPVFFKVFFGLLVPTLIGAFVGRRMIAKAEQ